MNAPLSSTHFVHFRQMNSYVNVATVLQLQDRQLAMPDNFSIVFTAAGSLLQVLCSVVPKTSARMLSSPNLHGAHKPVSDRVQFPRLPPEWEEKYKPGQMYRHQASLPQLPIPSLQQTLQKYITSVEVWELSCCPLMSTVLTLDRFFYKAALLCAWGLLLSMAHTSLHVVSKNNSLDHQITKINFLLDYS